MYKFTKQILVTIDKVQFALMDLQIDGLIDITHDNFMNEENISDSDMNDFRNLSPSKQLEEVEYALEQSGLLGTSSY